MKGFHALGVTQVNDSYPNVKYKLAALGKLLGEDYCEYIVPLDRAGASQQTLSAPDSNRLVLAWRLFAGHVRVLLYSLRHRANSIYVCYPGIFIAAWLGLPFMRRRYRYLYLDAFISLYDTVVFDRQLLEEGGLLAKLLFRFERRAFNSATTVLVDTPENARYYSDLFKLPQDRFFSMALSIPPLPSRKTVAEPKDKGRMRCVFIGTFVPLQGIRTIIEAAELLLDDSKIDFVFVGDGQDANYLQTHIEESRASNVTWHRGHFPTPFVIDQILDADLCLGIFGDGPKAQRVLPYKIYYYLALGMPIVTATTATTNRIASESDGDSPLFLVPPGNARSLADALLRLRDNPDEMAHTARAGADYYQRELSDGAIQKSLHDLFDAS